MREICSYPDLYQEFHRIMQNEAKYNPACEFYAHEPIDTIYLTAKQIQEVAKSSLILRSYVTRYNLSTEYTAHESVAAHTNLVMMLADRAIALANQLKKKLEHSYREIAEFIRIHDLPENKIGDWPDNGSTDLERKAALEREYLHEYALNYPAEEYDFKQNVLHLFEEMTEKSTYAGRLIYSADKTAAIIITLTYDMLSVKADMPVVFPLMQEDDEYASNRDKTEMSICDYTTKRGEHKASEMWTIDHLHIRKLNQYDDTGFFTAIIVMYTLLVNGHWYKWREKDYQQ